MPKKYTWQHPVHHCSSTVTGDKPTQTAATAITSHCQHSTELDQLHTDTEPVWLSVTLHLHPSMNYLSTMCQPVAKNPNRRYLRSAACADLAVPLTRTTRYGPRSFAVAGPSTWNSLPAPLRNCQLSSSFRHELKPELFARAYLH